MSADQSPPSYPPPSGASPPVAPPAQTPQAHPGPYAPDAGASPPPAAPYRPPQDPRFGALIEPAASRQPKALGSVALVLALAALVGGAAVLTVVGLPIGAQLARAQLAGSPEFDLSQLTPVRDAVLTGEITAWVASAFGVWALAQGVVAIVRRRGRGAGIAAVAIAVTAPVVVTAGFFLGFVIGLGIGIGDVGGV